MPKGITVEIVYNKFPEIARKLPQQTSNVVQRTAFEIESGAKVRCPVDTGALRASIQTEMETDTSAGVYTNIEYAPYVEFGTSRMGAQPYMTPAAEAARPRFLQDMSNLEALLG